MRASGWPLDTSAQFELLTFFMKVNGAAQSAQRRDPQIIQRRNPNSWPNVTARLQTRRRCASCELRLQGFQLRILSPYNVNTTAGDMNDGSDTDKCEPSAANALVIEPTIAEESGHSSGSPMQRWQTRHAVGYVASIPRLNRRTARCYTGLRVALKCDGASLTMQRAAGPTIAGQVTSGGVDSS